MPFDITKANWGREETQPKVVQVVNTVVDYNVTTTSNTFVDSPLSAAITPLYSDSSIRIIYNVYGGSSSGMGVPLRVKRDIGGTTSIPLSTILTAEVSVWALTVLSSYTVVKNETYLDGAVISLFLRLFTEVTIIQN